MWMLEWWHRVRRQPVAAPTLVAVPPHPADVWFATASCTP
jgi:hypothetical protein